MTHDASTVFPLHRYKQTEIFGEKLCWAALTPLAESAFGKDCVAAVTPPSGLPQRSRGAEGQRSDQSLNPPHLSTSAALPLCGKPKSLRVILPPQRRGIITREGRQPQNQAGPSVSPLTSWQRP